MASTWPHGSARARASTRRTPRIAVAGLLVGTAAIAASLGYQWRASPSSTAAPPAEVPTGEHRLSPGTPDGAAITVPPRKNAPRQDLGEAGGAVPDGTAVFDGGVPGVANLDLALLAALRRAATDAAHDGVELHVNSGWRSPAYQEQLLREAVAKYGSEAEAARWVATPETSPHVAGDAVDIGPRGAAAWLAKDGARYGLCRIYRNEPWHYELRPVAIGHHCPPMYADPTQDPRMQQ